MNKTILLTFAAKDAATAVTGKLRGGISKLGDASKGAHQRMLGLGTQVAKVGILAGAAAVGGVLALTAGLAGAIKAAAEESTGIERLGQTLQKNVPHWDGQTAAIERVISKREGLAFADDQLRDSLATLVTRTHDVSKAFDLQTIAMNLARAKNISLASASAIIGKVYAGNVKALNKFGFTIEKGTTATEALAQVQKATAGQAEKYGKTLNGAFETMQIRLSDVVEDIGAAFLPAALALADTLSTKVIPMVQAAAAGVGEWVADNQPLIDSITTLVTGAIAGLVDILLNKVAPAISTVIGLIGDWFANNGPLIDSIGAAFGDALGILNQGLELAADNLNIVVPFIAGPLVVAFGLWAASALAAGAATLIALAPLALIAAGIGLLAVAWSENWGGIRDTVTSIVNAITPFIRDTLLPAIQSVIDIVLDLAGEFGNLFNDVIKPAMNVVLGALAVMFKDVVQPAIALVFDIAGKVADALGHLFNDVIRPAVDTILPPLRTGFDLLAKAIDAVLGFVTSLLGPIGQLVGFIGDVVGGLQDILGLGPKASKAYTGPTGDQIRAGAQGGNGPGRAFGGLVVAGSGYTVGERGREQFTPDVTGRIVPTTRSSGGNVFNITVPVPSGITDPEQWSARAVQGLVRRLRREGIE